MSKRKSKGVKKLERRRAPRAKARIPVKIEKGENILEAKTRNISSSGAYCTLDNFIPLNTKLGVTLLIPDRTRKGDRKVKRVKCHGIVVRNQPEAAGRGLGKFGLALFFTDLKRSDRSKISTYVEKRLPSEERIEKPAGAPGGYDPGEIYVTDIPSREGFSISSANFRVLGKAVNLSRNGICMQTDRQIPLFHEIAVNLVFPGNSGAAEKGFKAVQCSGVVVGCDRVPKVKRYDLAVYFIGLSKEDKNRIGRFVEEIH